MFKRKKLGLILIALFGILAKQTAFADGWTEVVTARRTISLAGIGVVAYGIYKFGPKFYNDIQEKINNKINEEIIDSLILLLAPNYVINKLDDEEKKQKFQKKARLQGAKDRIMERLQDTVNSKENSLSRAHRKQLQDNLNKAKTIFDSASYIDKGISFFTKTQIKLDHKAPSYIDQFIEARVCTSIIFSSKPINECTESEKIRRAKSKESIKPIIVRKISQFGETLLLQQQIIDLLCD